ncbi:MAG: hypothetical protein ACE5EO_13110 [Candidatus Krumholzibacteriia bacterium]
MMKFFRKHNKKLLAVFMTLLMIVFLGGSALDTLLRPSTNVVVATTIESPITYADQQVANETTSILTTLGYPWQYPGGYASEPLELMDWILLSREARRLGLSGGISRIQATLEDSTLIEEQARRLRKKPERILAALAQFAAVQELTSMIGASVTPSEAEVAAAARKTMEKVQINAVVLPAKVFVDQDAEFTEEALSAQFEKYRDREPGEGLAFGYYVPPAIKVQYIKIDQASLVEQVRVANLEYKAKTYYKEQRERNPAFRRPPEEMAPDPEEDETFVGPVYEKPPYLTWEEARDKAVENVRSQQAAEAASRLADWLVQYTSEAWLDMTRGEDGYKAAPPGVADEACYARLLENVPATIAYPDAVSVTTTDFFSQEEAGEVPDIGGSYFFAPRGGSWKPFEQLAFNTQAIVPKVPEGKNVNPSDYLAMYQTCRYPVRDAAGNLYVFRVIAARAGHVPESLDEVRERVVADLRVLQGFERAKARAESLRSCEASLTLEEAYRSDEDLAAAVDAAGVIGSGFVEPPPFPRTSRINATGAVADDMTVVGGGLGRLSAAVVEELFAMERGDGGTEIVELPDRAALLVVEWVHTQRTKPDEFDDGRAALLEEIRRARSRTAIGDWLKPENIRARNAFALATR